MERGREEAKERAYLLGRLDQGRLVKMGETCPILFYVDVGPILIEFPNVKEQAAGSFSEGGGFLRGGDGEAQDDIIFVLVVQCLASVCICIVAVVWRGTARGPPQRAEDGN